MATFPRLLAAALPLLVSGCGEPRHLADCRDLVHRFEAALLAKDRTALAGLVTAESRAALDSLPLSSLGDKKALEMMDAVERPDGVHVRVRDPNDGDRQGALVVVCENGTLRLDLVASAGLSARAVPLPGPRQRTVLRPLSPQDRERAALLAARSRPDRSE